MNLEKHNLVLSLGVAMMLILISFSCQRSPLAPDEDLVKHLQALSDSSELKKQNSQERNELTTEELDALRGHPLESSNSTMPRSIPPILGYLFVAIIIIGFGFGFYFVVIKRVKNGISDISYQIKHAKDKIEDTIEQQTSKDINPEEKEKIDELLEQLNKFNKKT